VEAFDHTPVSDAFVMVENVGRGATNARGQLTVDGLCPGTVMVEIIHPAFEEARRRVALVNGAAVEIELAPLIETVSVTEKAAPPTDMRATAVVTGEALERKRG